MLLKILLTIAVLNELSYSSLGLYPQESESRIVFDLSGIWNFRISTSPNQGFDEKWYLKPLSEVSGVIIKFTDITRIIPCYYRLVRLLTWLFRPATMISLRIRVLETTLVGFGMIACSSSSLEERPTNDCTWDLKESITIAWWWVLVKYTFLYTHTHAHTTCEAVNINGTLLW